jgi:flagellar basal-body rod modification protein FlgD
MAIQAINQTTPQTAGGSIGGTSMGRDDFLKLLIAQLQNQDPLKPLDNQEFAAQLATFNSLDQLIGINQKLDGLGDQQRQVGQLGAAALIGKEIIADGNQVALDAGQPATIGYSLNSSATRVALTISDAAGKIVRTLDLGSRAAGDQSVVWDGRDGTGKTLPAGVYSVQVNAFDVAGNKIGASGQTRGVVTGVGLSGSDVVLEIGALKIPLSAVKGVL